MADMKRKTIEAYLIRYWATDGIRKVTGEVDEDEPKYLTIKDGYYTSHAKSHWSADRDEAIVMAERLRMKKIESLKRQIAKLEKLEIKVHE